MMKILKDEYNIKSINSITEPKTGSGNTLLIKTNNGNYVLKKNERDDFVKIYYKVQMNLNQKGFVQSKIILNKNDKLKTANYVLYEMINGKTINEFNDKQLMYCLNYLSKYNKELKKVSFCESEIKQLNNWDIAKSLNYMINIFREELSFYISNKKYQNILRNAVECLTVHKQFLTNNEKQLIHSDLGIDNFLFNGDRVVSVIDFTPEYEHEYYSVCQFFYWNFLYKENDYIHDSVNKVLKLYLNRKANDDDRFMFNLLLLKACLFRVIGPLLNSKSKDLSVGLQKRIMLVDKVVNKIN